MNDKLAREEFHSIIKELRTRKENIETVLDTCEFVNRHWDEISVEQMRDILSTCLAQLERS